MNKIKAEKDSVKTLPQSPGVYMFLDEKGEVIYTGKAKNLKSRVSSYFLNSLELKTEAMVRRAKYLNYIPVESEFDALLLEAKLVKKHRPKYNIELRDDKSPLYIGITNERLPRVILLRQRELGKANLKEVFGPFINSQAPKWVLKKVRKVFPYATHRPTKRVCVYKQIGLCDPCPSEVKENPSRRKEYLRNVRMVKKILSGKAKFVIDLLNKEMNGFSKIEDFEKAAGIRKKIEELQYAISRKETSGAYLENPNFLEDIRARELSNLRNIIAKYYSVSVLRRIECYDIAHLMGTYPTASMVTFVNGEADKSLYRHYKVSDSKRNNDVESIKSVLLRRKLRFSSWGVPDLIIVDGGKGQLAKAQEVISDIPIVGLAKREETLVFKMGQDFYEFRLPDSPAKKLVQRIRDEAHRFARSYHHKLVSRAIKES